MWDWEKRVLLWGGTPYGINHIPRQKNKVQGVKIIPVELGNQVRTYQQVNLLSLIEISPYNTQFVAVEVKESPESHLVFYPQPRFSHNSHTYLLRVNQEHSIYLPLTNPTKKRKFSGRAPS